MELKKLLRTILSLVMVATLVLGSVAMLAGCQNTDNDKDPDNKNNVVDYAGLEKEEYLQELAKNNMGALVDSVGEVYDTLLGGMSDSSAAQQASGAKLNMTITVGDAAMALLKQMVFGGEVPFDISFLQEINLDMDIGMKEQVQAMQLALGLKGQHIITANLLMNLAESVIHIGLPELNDQWLKFEAVEDASDAVMGGMPSAAVLANLANALPDAETLNKVLDRYLGIILDGLDNVEQSNITLEVNGVKQECTVLALKIYEEDAMNIAKAVLTKAKDDAELKKIIEDFAKGVEEMAGEDMGADEAYADFKDAIEELLADLEEEPELDTENFIQLDTYVDKNHNIIGMKLHDMSEQGSNRGQLYFYALTQGEKTAFELAIPSDVDNTDNFKLSGTGTKNGDKLSGTYTASVQGKAMATIQLENLDAEGGTITVTPSMDLFPSEVKDMLGNLSLQIKLDGEKVALNILSDNELLIGFAVKVSESDGPNLSEPSNAVDATNTSALEKWAEKIALDKVMSNLEKVGADEIFGMLISAFIPSAGY